MLPGVTMKLFFPLLALLFLLPQHALANNQITDKKLLELIVYKTPSCGCCKNWISHLTKESINAHPKNYKNISPIKIKYGINPEYRSCHTAVSNSGFIFEGHIPAKFIEKFLSEKHPNAIGLSVPGMPLGSPGMEQGTRFMPYKVLLLLKDGSSATYAEVSRYEDQF